VCDDGAHPGVPDGKVWGLKAGRGVLDGRGWSGGLICRCGNLRDEIS